MEPVNGFFVYSFAHDDDQQGWTPIEAFSYTSYSGSNGAPESQTLTQEFVNTLHLTLKSCGWEGDGTLSATMVPPFFSNEDHRDWFPRVPCKAKK
jgi:hypothetical protein